MILNEVSEYAPKKLREMEETFAILKKSSNNKNARLQLLKQIKEFTKIHDVVLFFDNEFNLGVITKYKNDKLLSVIKSFASILKPEQKRIRNNTLVTLNSVEESSEAIDIIYIFIGRPMIKQLTPKEMVAVLLHEFGHVYSTTSNLPENLLFILKSIILKPIKISNSMKDWLFSKIVFLYTLAVSVFIHGITFTQHVGEHNADNFALRYGYGDELILALNKFNTREKIKKSKTNKLKDFLKTLSDIFLRFFTPTKNELSDDPHPEVKTRIEKLERQMFSEYKRTYPNYKEVFDLIRSDYNKQEAKTK